MAPGFLLAQGESEVTGWGDRPGKVKVKGSFSEATLSQLETLIPWQREGFLGGSLCRPYFPYSVICCCLVAKICLTLCNPMDYSPPGSSVHGISQVRILEGVAISSSRGSSQPKDQTHLSWVSCTAGGLFYHLSHCSRPKVKWFAANLGKDSKSPKSQPREHSTTHQPPTLDCKERSEFGETGDSEYM